jgi:hypothetical protein
MQIEGVIVTIVRIIGTTTETADTCIPGIIIGIAEICILAIITGIAEICILGLITGTAEICIRGLIIDITDKVNIFKPRINTITPSMKYRGCKKLRRPTNQTSIVI